ncbi:AMP-binding protein [Thermomonospora catenispora]|uniref:AMP-binding protein n=1 Tax=Thermomonospora catenispora TaxID=2493090 RepID=UPI001120F3D0|nr:AMP-binding protein [Thermomonospora catenispora]TNY36323.1 AMP-dependent synthetase [Thermomonospora catenispora]
MERPLHALLLPPGPRLLQALAEALDGTGPAICPLDPGLPAPALRTMLDALAPQAVETPEGIRPHEGGEPVAPDVAVLIATSGSTGAPKFVELTAAALRHSASATLERIAAAEGDRWVCCLPTHHIAGLQVLVRSLIAGTDPVIVPRFSPAAVGEADARHLSVVPTQLHRLLDAGTDLSRFGTILLGGAAAAPDLVRRARARGGRIVATYGMSETSGGCVYDGVPLDGVRVKIGEDGRIRLAGPMLFSGYRRRPDATAEARDGDWFRTQDLGAFEGGRLRVLGRVDDVINTGGEKVLATEVADVIAGHPRVREVVVVGRPDPHWGERVTAVIVPEGAPPTLEELRDLVRARLPVYAAPRELDVREAIPLLPSGKPDRRALRLPR